MVINFLFVKLWRNVCAVLSVAPQKKKKTARFTTTVHDKCLVKMEKTLTLWVKVFQKLNVWELDDIHITFWQYIVVIYFVNLLLYPIYKLNYHKYL